LWEEATHIKHLLHRTRVAAEAGAVPKGAIPEGAILKGAIPKGILPEAMIPAEWAAAWPVVAALAWAASEVAFTAEPPMDCLLFTPKG